MKFENRDEDFYGGQERFRARNEGGISDADFGRASLLRFGVSGTDQGRTFPDDDPYGFRSLAPANSSVAPPSVALSERGTFCARLKSFLVRVLIIPLMK